MFEFGEVGFELVFVDGIGDGHGCDGVADLLGEFVLFAELFPRVRRLALGDGMGWDGIFGRMGSLRGPPDKDMNVFGCWINA